jgi:hypothetical protein
VPDNAGAQIVPERIGVPVGGLEKPLHPVRNGLLGPLREGPGILPFRGLEQTFQVCHRVIPRLRPAKPRTDQLPDFLTPVRPLEHLRHTNLITHDKN